MYHFAIYIHIHITLLPEFLFFKLWAEFELAKSATKDCSDIGKVPVGDIAECKEAASELKKSYHREGYWSYDPKGCFCIGNAVYWNTHEIGGSERNFVVAICKHIG